MTPPPLPANSNANTFDPTGCSYVLSHTSTCALVSPYICKSIGGTKKRPRSAPVSTVVGGGRDLLGPKTTMFLVKHVNYKR